MRADAAMCDADCFFFFWLYTPLFCAWILVEGCPGTKSRHIGQPAVSGDRTPRIQQLYC